jgi:hypothetical protein
MVRSYLQELENCGLITVEQRGKTITNRYFLTDKINSEWNPTSASDRKHTSTHNESDRKPVSTVTGSTVPLVTGSQLPTNKTQGNKTQINKTQSPPTPKDLRYTKKSPVVDEHAKAKELLRTLIARPNETFINGGASKLINDLASAFPENWICAAYDLAAGNNGKLTYVKAVLDHWKNHSFKCECRNPKSIEPIPIRHSQPQMSPYGVPYADPVNTYERTGVPVGEYGKDYVWGYKEA